MGWTPDLRRVDQLAESILDNVEGLKQGQLVDKNASLPERRQAS
jgi:hypothetical protein